MQKNRQCILTVVLALCMISALIGFLFYMENGLRSKTSFKFMNRLINHNRNVDVLVVGDSQVASDFYPMELWAEYGMTSYVLRANNNGLKRCRPMTELALDYCDPKLIVLNTDQYWEVSSPEKQLASYHEYADAFPLSKTKVQTTFSLLDDSDARKEVLFPFLLYHDRWKEETDSDFILQDTPTKGADYEIGITTRGLPDPSVAVPATLPEEGSENIDVIIDFVHTFEARGIPVLVVTFPFEMETGSKKLGYLQALEDTLSEKGIAYLNFAKHHEALSPETDFEDGAHLSILGGKTMTSLLGDIFQKQYQIPDRRSESSTKVQWNADYADYKAMKIEAFQKAESLQHALLLAKDRDYTPVVYLDWSSAAWQDETCMALLKNLSSFEKLEEARDTQCSFLGIVDSQGNPSSEVLDPDTPEWQAALGSDGAINEDSADAFVAIFDKADGKFLRMKAFKTAKELVSKIETTE